MMTPKRKMAARPRPAELIRTRAFQCVSFYDAKQERQIIILYSLGEDGILREYAGGKWHPFPVSEDL